MLLRLAAATVLLLQLVEDTVHQEVVMEVAINLEASLPDPQLDLLRVLTLSACSYYSQEIVY